MSAAHNADASPALAQVQDSLKSLVSGPKLKEASAFAARLFEFLPEDEYADRTAAVWAALTLDLLRFFRERPAHAAKVRVYNPTQEDDGWEGTHTVIQIVNDDMPFLVDTVSLAIAQDNTLTHLIMHPVMRVTRDPGGHILAFGIDKYVFGMHRARELASYVEKANVADVNEAPIFPEGALVWNVEEGTPGPFGNMGRATWTRARRSSSAWTAATTPSTAAAS